MAKERIISGIDVGSSKVTTIISSIEDDQIQIIGVHSVPSRGIRKGVVVDIDEAVETIEASLEGAERMAGLAVAEALITVDGQHISSENSQGVVAVSDPEGEITNQDVDRVVEAARAISIPASREIIDVMTRSFTVDSQGGVQDPIGMSGVRLQVATHIVHGAVTSLRNLVKCIHQVGVDVGGLVFEGFASAEAVLNETERELGVALVEIGGGTTDIVLFVEGAPAYSAVLPIGGKNITNDIAIGLQVRNLDDAEKIKVHVSSLPVTAGKNEPMSGKEEIDISELNIEGVRKVDKKFIRDGIIRPRLEEIFEQVAEEIRKSGYENMLPSGVVITGGGASTIGVTDVVKRVLRTPVRVGSPLGVSGLIDEVSTPAFAASIGNIIYGSKYMSAKRTKVPLFNRFETVRGYINKAIEWGKSFLP